MSSTMSLIYKRKSRGPRIEPCGTQAFTEVEEVSSIFDIRHSKF